MNKDNTLKDNPWASQSIEEITQHFQTNLETGLSSSTAEERLHEYGFNETNARDVGILAILLRQLNSPFIYLLFGVAIVTFASQGISEGCIIIAIMLMNIALGSYQEYSSGQELKKLKQYIEEKTSVLRDGVKKQIDTRTLVPGDIILLVPGDIINADIRLAISNGLMVDESVLTGESYTQLKQTDPAAKNDHNNPWTTMVFAGTSVVSGDGKGIVVATGNNSMFGTIANLALETTKVSSFVAELMKVSKFIVVLVIVCLVCVLSLQLLLKGNSINFMQLAVLSCVLAVCIIPNALPLVITFSLSRGARTLARHKVIVKRLESIEDLGNMDILCVDKTGTLTENTLSFLDAYTVDTQHSVVRYAALPRLLASDEKMFGGFDQACYEALPQQERNVQGYHLLDVKPFDPQKAYARYVVQYNHHQELIIQGVPEDLFQRCSSATPAQLTAWLNHHATLGSRIIGLAYKEFQEQHIITDKDLENDFTLLGCIAFSDPIKDTAAEAVIKAQKLGVTIKVLSGDRKEVCGTVAHAIGLIEDPHNVMTGAEYAALNEKEKQDAIKRYTVFARVYPEQKYEIVDFLQKDGVVGYLGDGINDAPALRKANVAITVQNAADIARGEADIILLKKSLMVIINGIHEGRKIFANSVKYIRITLASNFGNFFSIVIASLMLDFLPILPVQILLGDILTDFPMMAISTDNTDQSVLKKPRHYSISSLFVFISIMGCISTLLDILFFLNFKSFGAPILQTNWFVMSCLTEIVAIFSLRTNKFIMNVALPSLPIIILSSIVVLVITILPSMHAGHQFFGFTSITHTHVIIICALALLYLILNELTKYVLRLVKKHTNFLDFEV